MHRGQVTLNENRPIVFSPMLRKSLEVPREIAFQLWTFRIGRSPESPLSMPSYMAQMAEPSGTERHSPFLFAVSIVCKLWLYRVKSNVDSPTCDYQDHHS